VIESEILLATIKIVDFDHSRVRHLRMSVELSNGTGAYQLSASQKSCPSDRTR